jgi:hypothetical protein
MGSHVRVSFRLKIVGKFQDIPNFNTVSSARSLNVSFPFDGKLLDVQVLNVFYTGCRILSAVYGDA